MRRRASVLTATGMLGLLCSWLAGAPLLAADTSLLPQSRLKVPLAVPPVLVPFELEQVRILDGPFRHAQELDRQYLLSLDVDRLLHTFRVNAGLPSTAKPLGGWESPETELRGHFPGHYLTACALMYAATGDERLKDKAVKLVAGLAEVQARLGESGYLSAYPESFIDRVERRERVWAPYYTLHKILAGLVDVHVYCGDQQALDVAKKFGDWFVTRNARLNDEQMERMLGNEHGGVNEALANLYAVTGDRRYLDASLKFNHHDLLDPAIRGEDNLTGKHANTQVPKFIGHARQYELTGNKDLAQAARFFWDTVVKERSYVIGGHSDGEMFSPKERLSTAFGPSTTETCNTYNMLKLTRHLFAWDPRVEYADYDERALFNHILASQDPVSGMMCYYVPLKPGSHKEYNTPLDSFWCCTGTGVENHAKYGDGIYFHTPDGESLFVTQLIASELDWKDRGLKLRLETSYPDEPTARLTVNVQKPTKLAIRLRHPQWCAEGFAVSVNGEPVAAPSEPGSWFGLEGEWHDGDVVTVAMPFKLRAEGFADNPRRVAILNGPIVLAAQVDASRPVPAVVGSLEALLSGLEPVEGKPSTFRAPADIFRSPGAETTEPLTLEPFFKIHGGRSYTVYFDVTTPTEWEKREAEYRAEIEREKALEAVTIDVVRPGQEQQERDHSLAGERTGSGPFENRSYRHATDGGWFSWKLETGGQREVDLLVTYWGDDAGARTFDVVANGTRLATESLRRERPGEFFVRTYCLPAELVAGKDEKAVTIRFQAHPGNFAGGVFEARTVRREGERK